MAECNCGCGGQTAGGKFLPGHDQKLRAEIERQMGGLIKLKELVESHLMRTIKVDPHK